MECPLAPWLLRKVGDRFGVLAVRLVDSVDGLAGHREMELHSRALVRAAEILAAHQNGVRSAMQSLAVLLDVTVEQTPTDRRST